MSTVRASIEIPACRIAEAEALWYDAARWPAFIDGLKYVDKLEGDHPRAGARVVWDSFPHGRGRVIERVIEFTEREGQRLEVEDEAIRGTQRVSFKAAGGATWVGLELVYEIKARTIVTPLTDLLFIRRAQRESLARTLLRFRRELDPAAGQIT